MSTAQESKKRKADDVSTDADVAPKRAKTDSDAARESKTVCVDNLRTVGRVMSAGVALPHSHVNSEGLLYDCDQAARIAADFFGAQNEQDGLRLCIWCASFAAFLGERCGFLGHAHVFGAKSAEDLQKHIETEHKCPHKDCGLLGGKYAMWQHRAAGPCKA
jgi:hypothetical protein